MDRAAFAPDQVDAIVFDVIGTLVDEDGTWATVAERLAAEAGVDDGAGLYTAWAEILERLMNAVVGGTAPWRPHRQLVTDSAREAITQAGLTSHERSMAMALGSSLIRTNALGTPVTVPSTSLNTAVR